MESKQNRYILIGLTVFCILLIGVTAINDQWLAPLRTGVGYVLIPIQSGVNRVGISIYQELSDYGQLKTALEENRRLQSEIDRLIEEIRSRHISRLQTGTCTIQLGFVLNDLLGNFERVSDHCSNIAVSVIEERTAGTERHAYLHDMKAASEFAASFEKELKTYKLP